MTTKKLWLKFDCTEIDMFDLINAVRWRIDPIRPEILKLKEELEKVDLVNIEKTKLPQDVKSRVDDIRKYDKNEADLAARDFIMGYLTLWIPTEVHKHIRQIIDLEIGDNPDKSFTTEDIPALLKEVEDKEEEIKNKSRERVIVEAVKEVFEQSVAPQLGSLAISQREILSKMASKDDISKMASKDDISKMASKDDISMLLEAIEKIDKPSKPDHK